MDSFYKSQEDVDAVFNTFWDELGNRPGAVGLAVSQTRAKLGGTVPTDYVPSLNQVRNGIPPVMQVGINYPWAFDKYGLYFGSKAGDWMARWVDFLSDNLTTLKELGVTHVRIFLLCNGCNYGTIFPATSGPYDSGGEGAPPAIPSPSPYEERNARWTFQPPDAPDEQYGNQLVQMLQVFQAANMQVIPSFVDSAFFAQTRYHAPGGGRYDAMNDPKKQAILLAFLDYLLDKSKAYTSTIYAWELINEPIWLARVIAKGFQDQYWGTAYAPMEPTVTEATLRDFLAEGCRRIEAKGFASTVGHALAGDLDTFRSGRGSKPQFHYYGATAYSLGAILGQRVPEYSEVQRFGDVFLGEIGANASQGWGWPELNGKDRSNPNDRVFLRLRHVASLGYKLALVWPDLGWNLPKDAAGKDLDPGAPGPVQNMDTAQIFQGGARGFQRFTSGAYANGVPARVTV